MKPSVDIVPDLSTINPIDWNQLVHPNNPFCTHAFLLTLESSGSVGGRSGWQPCHVVVKEGDRLIAGMPLYLKTNSYGEYIFDWGWADASERAGIPYYPKLVSAIPFTPASGDRLLVHPEYSRQELEPVLINVAASRTTERALDSLVVCLDSTPPSPVYTEEKRYFH